MPRLLSRFGLVLTLLAVSACSLAKPPQDIDAAAKLAFEQLRRGEDAALLARGTPELKAADPTAFAAMRAMIPKGEMTASKVISWRATVATGGHNAEVQHRYDFAAGTLIVDTALARPNGEEPWQVHGLHFTPVAQEDIQANAFTFAGKTASHFAFFATTIASPLLMIIAIVLVIRAPGLKRKWLWCLLALAGIGAAHMNWTTGEISFNALSLQFIGAGAMKNLSPVAPWVLSMTIPVGAVLAILRARKAGRDSAEARTEPAGS